MKAWRQIHVSRLVALCESAVDIDIDGDLNGKREGVAGVDQ
jgi:hypothetical protein